MLSIAAGAEIRREPRRPPTGRQVQTALGINGMGEDWRADSVLALSTAYEKQGVVHGLVIPVLRRQRQAHPWGSLAP